LKKLLTVEERYLRKALKRLGIKWFLLNLVSIFAEESRKEDNPGKKANWKRLVYFILLVSRRFTYSDSVDD